MTAAGTQSGWRLGESGGEPWLVLHGGPGSGASPALLAAFDAARHTAWGPHQRGSGTAGWQRARRLPVAAMVSDLEALRVALTIPRWSVMGGSWGAYLALAYLRRYPASVERLVLRGSFLGGADDVWALVRSMPGAALRQAGLPPPTARSGLVAWLVAAQRLFRCVTPGPATRQWVRAWRLGESRTATRGARRAWLHAGDADADGAVTAPWRLRAVWRDLRRSERLGAAALRMRLPVTPAQARKVALQARLLSRGCDHLLRGAVPGWRDWLAHAAASAGQRAQLQLLHGRFDAVCSPRNVHRLQAWFADPACARAVGATGVHAGHLAMEPAMAQALRNVLRGDAC
ncbi:MAG: alpha/beta fold hydrolase [Cupriavidus necator]